MTQTSFRSLAALRSNEEGASYAISLVLALPLYVTMVALVVEVASLVSTGMALDAAASAAARSATAWLPLEGSAARKVRQIKRAAVMALVSASDAGAGENSSGGDAEGERAFVAAYRRFTPHPLPNDQYLAAKYRAAEAATTVTINPPAPRGGDRVTVRVEFRAPIRVPGFGRWLGDATTGGRSTRRIVRELSFTLEPTSRQRHPLGITYDRLR